MAKYDLGQQLQPWTPAGNRMRGRQRLVIFEEADLVILVATRANQNGTDSWDELLLMRVIHIVAVWQEIGPHYEALRLFRYAAATLEALCGAFARATDAT